MRVLKILGLVGISVFVGCGGTSRNVPDEPGHAGANDQVSESGSAGDEANADAGEGAESNGTAAGSVGRGGVSGLGTGGTLGFAGAPTLSTGGLSSVGGAPAEGTGGNGGVTAILPEGCVLESQTSVSGYCQLSASCENDKLYVSCKDQGDSRSFCACNSGMAKGWNFTIDGTATLSTCEALAEICASDVEPALAPEECSPVYDKRSATSCDLRTECTRRLETDESAWVTVSASSASCYQEAPGRLICTCSEANKSGSYALEGADGNTACDVTSEICGEELEFTGRECAPTTRTMSSEYCSMQFECTEAAEIADGVRAARYTQSSVDCQPYTEGVSLCACYRADGSAVAFEFEGTPTLASCDAAASFCADPSAVTLTGELECPNSSQTVQQGLCYSTFECSQNGTLGDMTVKARGMVETSCSQVGEEWSCTCSSGSSQATTKLPRTGNDWDDCAAASEQCRGLVDLGFGESLAR